MNAISIRIQILFLKLTNSMVMSPSWEEASCAATQKLLSTFYATHMFITVFTRALHWSLSWARSIQSTSPHSNSLRSTLVLSTHLRFCLPSGLFPSGFPTNVLYAFLFFPFVLHVLLISSSLTWSFWLLLFLTYRVLIAHTCSRKSVFIKLQCKKIV
jgi:hypothetical protein